MNEIKERIDFIKLQDINKINLRTKNSNEISPDTKQPLDISKKNQKFIDHVLLRFSVVDPARINKIILDLIDK